MSSLEGVGIVKLCWKRKAIFEDLGSVTKAYGDDKYWDWDAFNAKVRNAFFLGSPSVKYHYFYMDEAGNELHCKDNEMIEVTRMLNPRHKTTGIAFCWNITVDSDPDGIVDQLLKLNAHQMEEENPTVLPMSKE